MDRGGFQKGAALCGNLSRICREHSPRKERQLAKGIPMSLKPILIAASLALASTLPPSADNMPGMDMSKPMGDQGASSQAFAVANTKMHKDMTLTYTGDAD